MAVEEYLTGLLFFAAASGSALGAAAIVVWRRLFHLARAERALAFGIVGSAAVIAAHVVPGILGVLDRWTAAVAGGILLGASLLVKRVDARPDARAAREPLASWALAAPAIAAAAIGAVASVRAGSALAIDQVDWVSFTLPNVANWIHAGSLFDTTQFLPLFPVSAYPNNGDVLYLAAILPWHDDAFVRFIGLPVLALIGIAVYALARELRAPASLAVLAAAVALSLRAITGPALEGAKPDGFMLAAFGAGLVFLVRHARTHQRSDLVLAGLGLGLALGARWYGLSSAVVVVGVWAAAWLVARRREWRWVMGRGAALCGVIALGGGFWIVRNVIVLGNPIGTVEIAPFGVTLFAGQPDPLRDLLGSSLASYLDNPRILEAYALPDYTAALGLPGVALAATLVAGAAIVLRHRRRLGHVEVVVAALVVCAVGIAVAYATTPGSAQGFVGRPLPGLIGGNSRWLMPAALIAAAVGAWAAARAGRMRVVIELAAVVAVIDGLRRTFDLDAAAYLSTGVRLAAVMLIVYGAYRAWSQLGSRRGRLALAAAATAVAVVAVGVYGRRTQESFDATRYVGFEPTAEWVRANAPEGHRIGLAGSWTAGAIPTAALYGPRLRNYVAYLGEGDGALRLPYQRRQPFQHALRDGRFDLLVVGLQKRSVSQFRPSDLDLPLASLNGTSVPAMRWAESIGFREVARSDRFVLLRRSG